MLAFWKRLCAALLAILLPIGSACGLYTHIIAWDDPAPVPFCGVSDGALSKTFNAVYQSFHTQGLTVLFGNEAAYFEWMAEKIMWTDDVPYKTQLKEKIRQYPQTDSGYLWSWGTSTYWPTGDGNMHYDGLFRYICAVDVILKSENDPAFLSETDTDRTGANAQTDASEGKTVYEKCVLAIEYALRALRGSEGLITITEQSVYLADGRTRFDVGENGAYLWNNTGRNGSASSNYWDNLCFGHEDAYETALFYHALEAMADIETRLGHTSRAAAYSAYMPSVHDRFDETFWDADKGRYIACVDADGVRHDYGLTFLNTLALACGLGDAEKAAQIFAWLDGRRIVQGDTITGDAIRSYRDVVNANFWYKPVHKKLYFALRTNTVDIAAGADENGYWWESLNGGIRPDGNAAYGRHLENGGYIFYTLYDEWMARARYGDRNGIASRCAEVYAVYRYTSFCSDVGGWAEGLNGEFPENGLVSAVFIRALLGLREAENAVSVCPQLPDGVERLETSVYSFAGSVYTVAAGENTLEMTAQSGALPQTVLFTPKDGGRYTMAFTDSHGETLVRMAATDVQGRLGCTPPPDTTWVSVVCRPMV